MRAVVCMKVLQVVVVVVVLLLLLLLLVAMVLHHQPLVHHHQLRWLHHQGMVIIHHPIIHRPRNRVRRFRPNRDSLPATMQLRRPDRTPCQ